MKNTQLSQKTIDEAIKDLSWYEEAIVKQTENQIVGCLNYFGQYIFETKPANGQSKMYAYFGDSQDELLDMAPTFEYSNDKEFKDILEYAFDKKREFESYEILEDDFVTS